MQSKTLGNTGVQIGEIGIGTARYTGDTEPIRRALELGANLVDTAELYGTEELVGRALSGVRDQAFVATKVSPPHFRRKALIEAAERSLRKLNTDHIDLYQLHAPNSRVPIAETICAMEGLVDAGKVRYIGVSNFSVEQLREAMAAMTKHRIVANQVGYSLVDRRIEARLLEFCEQNNISVIAYSPLAEGLHRLKARDPDSLLERIASETGKTEAQVALNWCVSHPNVIAIPKASTIDHVEQNCGGSSWRLTPDQAARLEGGVKPYGNRDYVGFAVRNAVEGLRQGVRSIVRGGRQA